MFDFQFIEFFESLSPRNKVIDSRFVEEEIKLGWFTSQWPTKEMEAHPRKFYLGLQNWTSTFLWFQLTKGYNSVTFIFWFLKWRLSVCSLPLKYNGWKFIECFICNRKSKCKPYFLLERLKAVLKYIKNDIKHFPVFVTHCVTET